MPGSVATVVTAVLLLAMTIAWAIPIVRILHRAGLSGGWVVLGAVPGVNLVALWVFAYARWPAVDPITTPPPPR